MKGLWSRLVLPASFTVAGVAHARLLAGSSWRPADPRQGQVSSISPAPDAEVADAAEFLIQKLSQPPFDIEVRTDARCGRCPSPLHAMDEGERAMLLFQVKDIALQHPAMKSSKALEFLFARWLQGLDDDTLPEPTNCIAIRNAT